MTKKNKKPSRGLQKAVQYAMQPQEYNRLGELGVGAFMDMDGINAGDFSQQSLLWQFDQMNFPLTTSEFDRRINSERSVISCADDDTDDDCSFRRSPYLNCGTSFTCPFLMTRMCIVAVADGLQFTSHGVYSATQPAANSEIPQVRPYDLDNGGGSVHNAPWGLVADLSTIVGSSAFGHATLNYAWPVLRFLEKWMMSTRLQVVVCNKLLIADDLLSTIGMCMMAPTYEGAGGPFGVGIGPFIRCVNETMADKGLGVFITVNVSDDEATTICLPQPIVGALLGATKVQGASGGGYRSFDPGLLISPFMGTQFNFVNDTDDDCVCPLRTTSVVTTQSPHPNYLQDVSNITASCGNDTFVPGGEGQIGAVIEGYELSAMAVAAWIGRMWEAFNAGANGTAAGLKPREAKMLGQLQIIHEMGRSPGGHQYLRDVVETARARASENRRESTRRIAGSVAGFLEGPRP